MVDTIFWFPNVGLSPILVKKQAALDVFRLPRKEIHVPLYKEKYFPYKHRYYAPFQATNHWSETEWPFNNEYNSGSFGKKEVSGEYKGHQVVNLLNQF